MPSVCALSALTASASNQGIWSERGHFAFANNGHLFCLPFLLPFPPPLLCLLFCTPLRVFPCVLLFFPAHSIVENTLCIKARQFVEQATLGISLTEFLVKPKHPIQSWCTWVEEGLFVFLGLIMDLNIIWILFFYVSFFKSTLPIFRHSCFFY